jgi:predicted amidophosphoribosyltransferase
VPVTLAGVDSAWAASAYEGTARRLVTSLKFCGRLALAGVAARAIVAAVGGDGLRGALVPVAPDPLRHRLRGFDPAEAIARALAREARLPLRACLKRSHGRRQVGRSRSARLAGPAVGAAIEPPPEAILVDDVITTGATVSACARALREAGSQTVLAVAFARA